MYDLLMATATLNREGLNRLLVDPSGPVMLHLQRRGHNVLEAARQGCPVDLGVLRDSLKMVVSRQGAGNIVEVGSDLKELIYVEEGTGPGHEPEPNAPYFPPWNKPQFAVWADDHGWSPYQLAVHISMFGTRATHFLRDALRTAAL